MEKKIILALLVCIFLISSCGNSEKLTTLDEIVASDIESTEIEKSDATIANYSALQVSYIAEAENEDGDLLNDSINESLMGIELSPAPESPAPKFDNEYSEVYNAYREFLLGQRGATFNNPGYLLFYEYYTFGAVNSEFALVDINADGIPELHFRSRGYTIFSYRDGEVFVVDGFQRKAQLMNNLAVYTDYWAHNGVTEATRTYTKFGSDLQPCFKMYFDYSDESGIFRIAYNDQEMMYVTKQDFGAITAPVISYCTDPKNYDMISWTNFGEWLEKNIEEYVKVEHSPG